MQSKIQARSENVPCVLVERGSQGVQEGLPGMTPIFQQARIIWTLGCHDTDFPQPSWIIWTTCSTMLIIMLRMQVFKRDLHHVVNMGCILGGRIIAQPPGAHLLQHHYCFVQICAHLGRSINKTDTAPDNLIGGLKEALVSMEQPDIGISLLAPWQSPQPAQAQNQNFKPHQWTQYT